MGRTILADSLVESQIKALITNRACGIGLVIGQLSSQKYFALHLAQCPEDLAPDGQNIKGSNQLESISDAWAAQHARQVLRMLPGGLDILGIFAVAAPDAMKSAQPKLRQVLFAVHKAVLATEHLVQQTSSAASDRVLLQICSLTQKITCRTFDVSDSKSSAKPADWKLNNFINGFHQILSSLSVDAIIPISMENTHLSLEKQLLQGVMPLCENVMNSLVLVDGAIRDPMEPLTHTEPSTKKVGKKHATEEDGQIFHMQIYNQMQRKPDAPHGHQVACGARLWLRGQMCCRAYATPKSTVGEAIQMLKQDALRTLVVRCQLLCEDLLQSEEEQDPNVLYETPQRVFTPLSEGASILVCDYMFADETTEDCIQRQADLLGLTVTEDAILTDLEPRPEESDFHKPERVVRQTVSPISNSTVQSSSSQSVSGIFKAAVGVSAAAIAAALSYMYLDNGQ